MQQRRSGSCCGKNQYVALTGYVAQPRGGLKIPKSFIPNLLYVGAQCIAMFIYLFPNGQPHSHNKKTNKTINNNYSYKEETNKSFSHTKINVNLEFAFFPPVIYQT